VNFKRVVWHDSFYELLDSIHIHSKTGFHIRCGDGIVRHLFPAILILSADYEEQYGYSYISYNVKLTLEFCTRCFMALIRGAKGKFPCPICLVPHTQMSDGSTHPLWTSESMQKVYFEALEMSAEGQEEHLKGYGLRNVKVWKCFQGVVMY